MKTVSARTAAMTAILAMVLGLAMAPVGAAEEAPVPAPAAGRDSRIVGGTVAGEGAWPAQVALINRAAGSTFQGQFCGGTVVDRSWILTAAHCVSDPPDWSPSPGEVDVLVGTNSLNGGGTRIRAVEFRVHPGWDSSRLRNDVALIRLDRPVPSGIAVQALGTPEDWSAGGTVTAVGWGAQNDPPTQFPAALRQVDLESGSDPQCSPFLEGFYVSATQVCAYWPGQGVCFGDSGGPLLVRRGDGTYAQVGISSYVLRPCGDYPGFFTEVAAFSTWIRWQVRYGPQPNASAFVTRQYRDLFGRPPTGTELFYGAAALEGGQSTAAFTAGLLDGATFRGRSGGVVRLYRSIFRRLPESAGMTYWMGEANRGVSLKRMADQMVRAPEFTARYGAADDAAFVGLVYQNVLGRDPFPSEASYWVGQLASGARTRGLVMVGFSESAEHKALTAVDARTWGTSWALLRRVPTSTERTAWSALSTGDLARLLLASWSYANRF